MATESVTSEDAIEVFKQLEVYPWDTDKDFQSGLRAILGPQPSTDNSQVHDLTLRAQCFYLSRKKSIPIDFNAYKAYLAKKTGGPSSAPSISVPPSTIAPSEETISNNSSSELQSDNSAQSSKPSGPPRHPANFQDIVALIQSGKPIPGIMEIPDTVLTGQASQPSLPRRKKPWEKELPDTKEGTFGDRRDTHIEQEMPDEENSKA